MSTRKILLNLPIGYKGYLSDGKDLYELEKSTIYLGDEPMYSIYHVNSKKHTCLFEQKEWVESISRYHGRYKITVLKAVMSVGALSVHGEMHDLYKLHFTSKNSFGEWYKNLKTR